MTASDETSTSTGPAGVPWPRLARHYFEMVAAMLAGMMVLGMTTRLALALLGQADLLERLEVQAAVMVLTMGAGMTVWMRYRRHRWAGIVEMNVAMLLSFVVALLPFWAGALPESAVMAVGHILMLPAMAVVLLRRRGEFAAGHRGAGDRAR